ncbi:MAG TPA: galactokinase [Acidimicrobiia bacterium]|nr:galactokinase [Acidimicrobiia bacterium]
MEPPPPAEPAESADASSPRHRVARAPGRVNLIGDHTDYQEGWCVPMAIDREVVVTWTARPDAIVRATSDGQPGVVELDANDPPDPRTVEPRWGSYVAAVARLLQDRGVTPRGLDASVHSTVPVGAGLSSSAALEVAVACALLDAADAELAPLDVALLAQAAEHAATGVPCGIMDQLASVSGRAGHALLIDCRSLTTTPVLIPTGVAVLVVHSGVDRALVDSEYAARREACEAAARRLGVLALRDAVPADVRDDPFARHVVSENARALAFADALRSGDLRTAGGLMSASHASLRDDFRVSTPELDTLVDLLERGGAHGARLTGAGFGGCVVALVADARVHALAAETAVDYGAATGRTATPFVVRAADGARSEV